MTKTVYHEAGKGSKNIPRVISNEEYDKRWEETFGKGKIKESSKKEKT